MNIDREDRRNILHDKLNSDLLLKQALFTGIAHHDKYADQKFLLALECAEIRRQITQLEKAKVGQSIIY